MPFNTPDYPVIRDAILRDIANQIPGANVFPDGDYCLRANATAAAIEGLYQHQQWMVRQIFPDTSDTDYLEKHASLYGLTRKSASAATGTMTLAGAVGSSAPLGTQASTASGVVFVSTADALIGVGGTVSVAAQALLAGSSGNQSAGTALTLTAAPAGVLSAATIGTMTGGADVESDAGLLARLLDRLRLPPMGGSAHDYVVWALSVAGVSAAYVYPLRRGYGSVDVLILAAGGIPSGALVTAAQAYLDTVRPVQGDCLVLAPTAVPVAVTAALTLAAGANPVTVRAAVTAALSGYFAMLAPGDTVYVNRLRALISEVSGVVDFTLSAPGSNAVALVDATHSQICTLGTVTLT